MLMDLTASGLATGGSRSEVLWGLINAPTCMQLRVVFQMHAQHRLHGKCSAVVMYPIQHMRLLLLPIASKGFYLRAGSGQGAGRAVPGSCNLDQLAVNNLNT